MSWRDRDWARFNDDERRHLFGEGSQRLPSSQGRASHGISPTRRRINQWILAPLLALAVLAYGISRIDTSRGSGVTIRPVVGPSITLRSPTSTSKPVTSPSNVVSIQWRTSDLAPADHAGRICVTDSQHGQICAAYVIGERPADNLTREVERRGLQVESSGS